MIENNGIVGFLIGYWRVAFRLFILYRLRALFRGSNADLFVVLFRVFFFLVPLALIYESDTRLSKRIIYYRLQKKTRLFLYAAVRK